MKMSIVLIGILIISGVVGVFVWHQHRKSNTDMRMVNIEQYESYAVATFAGGCFWCSEADFEKTDGVVAVVSGYTGGQKVDPTYNEVTGGTTGHREAVQVFYEPEKVTYEQLLNVFWRHIDPTDAGGQFVDRGDQYTTAIFYHDVIQRDSAEMSKKQLNDSGKFDTPVVTAIVPFDKFFVAEDYHQDYYKNNGVAYSFYRGRSGRDEHVARIWGDTLHAAQKHHTCMIMHNAAVCDRRSFVKPSEEQLRAMLSDVQYDVTQEEKTERPFFNEYWDNTSDGIYVDIISGEPLFSSVDKYDSGTGWPSFVKPINNDNITEKLDLGLHLPRTEVRGSLSDAHLGHVFNDGPTDMGGRRYCINSAALRFISKDALSTNGYGEYVSLFD